jgi:hypothetical protein
MIKNYPQSGRKWYKVGELFLILPIQNSEHTCQCFSVSMNVNWTPKGV